MDAGSDEHGLDPVDATRRDAGIVMDVAVGESATSAQGLNDRSLPGLWRISAKCELPTCVSKGRDREALDGTNCPKMASGSMPERGSPFL